MKATLSAELALTNIFFVLYSSKPAIWNDLKNKFFQQCYIILLRYSKMIRTFGVVVNFVRNFSKLKVSIVFQHDFNVQVFAHVVEDDDWNSDDFSSNHGIRQIHRQEERLEYFQLDNEKN